MLGLALFSGLPAALSTYPVKQYTLNITSFDGVSLQARVAVPQVTPGIPATFPAVVMANSWAVPDIEYEGAQQKLGSAGYVVLEYEARGWFGSGGVVGLGDESDWKDMSCMVDTLVANAAAWHVDSERLASAGISYGAGLAVLGAVYDRRIKATASLSGWGNLTTAFFHGEAPHRVWANLLLLAGKATGRIPPELDEMWSNLATATNVAQTVAWADARSPEHYLAELARRDVPLFLSNNFEDRLFMPDAALEYRQAAHNLGIRTYMMLNQGIHAQAEAAGAIGLTNVVFDRLQQWLDAQLKGGAAGAIAEGTVDFELRPRGLFAKSERLTFGSWPPQSGSSVRYFLSGRGRGHSGALRPVSEGAPDEGADTIKFGELSGLSAGVPVVSVTLQTLFRAPILASLPLVRTTYAAVYLTEPLPAETLVCGTPNATFSATPSGPSFQLVGYLYDVEPLLQTGTLISHGGNDVWRDAVPGEAQLVQMRLRSLCVRVSKGHRVGFGVDMFTEMLTPASTDGGLSVAINVGSNGSFLELPLVSSNVEAPQL